MFLVWALRENLVFFNGTVVDWSLYNGCVYTYAFYRNLLKPNLALLFLLHQCGHLPPSPHAIDEHKPQAHVCEVHGSMAVSYQELNQPQSWPSTQTPRCCKPVRQHLFPVLYNSIWYGRFLDDTHRETCGGNLH